MFIDDRKLHVHKKIHAQFQTNSFAIIHVIQQNSTSVKTLHEAVCHYPSCSRCRSRDVIISRWDFNVFDSDSCGVKTLSIVSHFYLKYCSEIFTE